MKNKLNLHIALFILIRIAISTMSRMVYPFLPALARGMGVSQFDITWAINLRSLTGLAGPFVATIGDTRGRRFGMLFSLGMIVISLGLMAVWPSYLMFIVTLITGSLGYLSLNPSMQAYLGDHVPYERRGRALGLVELGWSLSFIIGVPVTGLVISTYGWQYAFLFLGILCLFGFLALLIVIPDDHPEKTASLSFLHNMRQVITSRPALAGLGLAIACTAANEIINMVFGVWMEDSFGLKIAQIGAASAILGVSELGGEVIVAGISDRTGKSILLGAGLALNCAAVLLLPLLSGSLTGALVGLSLFYITFEITIVSSIPMMTEILPSARATLLAAYISCLAIGRAIGGALAPVLYVMSRKPGPLSGMVGVALAVILFNLLALAALAYLRRQHHGI